MERCVPPVRTEGPARLAACLRLQSSRRFQLRAAKCQSSLSGGRLYQEDPMVTARKAHTELWLETLVPLTGVQSAGGRVHGTPGPSTHSPKLPPPAWPSCSRRLLGCCVSAAVSSQASGASPAGICSLLLGVTTFARQHAAHWLGCPAELWSARVVFSLTEEVAVVLVFWFADSLVSPVCQGDEKRNNTLPGQNFGLSLKPWSSPSSSSLTSSPCPPRMARWRSWVGCL
jgi:hypothetical protein